ncbi:unnamed protein product [Peronospora belbahrii]|uniref:Stc1 domain-containing protein n=1 Tax=Peronospora belbahrii TaxID=622444 RepID=A0AAU9LI98_9STRA|nr:unnamed protein product [Peronospora belbahrii]CAH0518258.1 unnamed protein product [Peronospora belbahrii]
MRKSLLLSGVLSSNGIQAEDGVGLQVFHGRALLTNTMDTDDYTVMSCKQVEEARCIGQCAKLWCDSSEIGDCAPDFRPIVRVADRCASCERGDLFLSHDILQKLSGINKDQQLFPVRWKCVDCGMNVGRPISSNEKTKGEKIHPGPESQVHAMLSLDNTTDQVAHQPIEELEDGGVGCSLSDENVAGSSDNEVEISYVINNDWNKGDEENSNSNGGTFSSSFGSASGTVRRGPLQKERADYFMSNGSSSSNHANDASSRPSPVSSTRVSISGSSTADENAFSGGLRSSSSTATQDSRYHLEATFFDNSQDARALSTSSSLSGVSPHKNQPPTAMMESLIQKDNSVDKSLSATSSVTKSPLFYASIMLGIVGLIGATVGHRAKQKRNYRKERRAFRMFAQMNAHACSPRPAPSSLRALASRPESHSIIIL